MNRDVSEEVAFEESVQEDAEEENVDQVQDTELQENDTIQRQVPFEESVPQEAEEEPLDIPPVLAKKSDEQAGMLRVSLKDFEKEYEVE